MGKGDKKTKRGKIILGTFGKLRPKRKKFNLRSKTVKGNQEKGA
ncbi:MAG: 30S ribosomal protein THX [Altibacter sp.]|nr:30S ribosomal protein THX [Altibacter lentus]MCW8980768.1 30S ribosomal protein THX [Altibacter sp.]